MDKMNSINVKQSETKSIRLLAAQSQLYSAAKLFTNIQFVVSVLVPPLISFVLFYFDSIKEVGAFQSSKLLALYGLLAVAVDILFLDKTISFRIGLASSIQQIFDSHVFKLKESSQVFVSSCDEEYILQQSRKYLKRDANYSKLHGWYSDIDDDLPLPVARMLCQRQNIYWSQSLRSDFIKLIRIIAIISITAIIAIAFSKHVSLFDFVTDIVAPSLPVVLYYTRESRKNKNLLNSQSVMLKEIGTIWEFLMREQIVLEDIDDFTYSLQNEIFKYRMESSLIPDIFYLFSRSKNENLSAETAKDFALEYFSRYPRPA